MCCHCRGANPPPCDSGTQSSRWRLRYDVYQYFLPESDLSEMGLMSHLRRMSGVQSVRANGLKVSPKRWVPAGCHCCSLLCFSPCWAVEWQPHPPWRPGLAPQAVGSMNCIQNGEQQNTGVGRSSPLSENTGVLEGRVPFCEPLMQHTELPFPDAYADS